MILWLLRNWQGVLAAALIAGPAGYGLGRWDGRKAGRLDLLKATVAAQEARKEIAHDVARMSYSDLCAALGGLPDQCRQLRGVGAPAPADEPGPARR